MATGGIALNGSSQYLEFNTQVVSAFPFTLVCWVAQNASGSSQFVIAQQQSNGDRYAAAWLDANGTTKYGNLRNPGNSDNASKTSSPHPSASLQLMVAVFTSTTSRTVYFGDNTGATSTTSMTDDISNHDRITIGAWHYNSGAAGLFLNGAVTEAHIFNTALSSSDVTTLLTTKPEEVAGWVDGWILSSNSDLTSIGGTRTLTAVGSPTTASLTLPYTRTTTPVLSSPVGTYTGTTTADAGATIDAVSGSGSRIMYARPRIGGSAASSATIISTGTQLAVTTSGAKLVPLTGLTTNSTYVADVVYVDATTGTSNVVTTSSFTPRTPIAFSGTVGNQSGVTGGSFSLDLSTYFSGSLTRTYAIQSGSLTGSGLSLNTSSGVISGTLATVAVYTVTVRATDSISATADTNSFTITVSATGTAPTVSSHPSDTTVTAGATASFTAAASGSPTPTVQWQENTGAWTNISGQTSTTLSLGVVGTGDNGRVFRAVFTNTSGSATTNSATLTVNAASGDGTITSEPLKRNNGQLLGANTLSWLGVRNSTTGAHVLLLTGVAVNSSSVFTVTNAAMSIGQPYTLTWKTATGEYGCGWTNAV
jgi:hypothetical protein